MNDSSSSRPGSISAARRRGRPVVLVGPSAVGTSTVVKRLREMVPDLWFSVSATTRAPRPGEVAGRDYLFVSRAEFDRMIDAGELLEWADIHGGIQRSGTPRKPVEQAVRDGLPVLIEVDLVGARAIRETMPDAALVFLAPPDWETLVARLRGRGTESPDVVERRLLTARTEMAAKDEFDHVVINDDVERAASELVSLLTGP
ncbi:guanylate kinase [Hoyosella sp. G463]|uniref:Guanylate kinase n=1 Tax=Lolliginicoccus lacisalsi TaxID=2742202 RepID=A0A927PLE0_9ACTN|nr:guanylate kinase [Lolliginicoccus lacisalsi]